MRQGQVLTIEAVQKTVEVPQVQSLDRVVDVPVVMQRQVPCPLMPKERIQWRTVEETINAPVPFLEEEIIEAAQHILQERMQYGTEEQIVDAPVPQCRNETGEVIQIFPQDRVSDRIVDHIVGRAPVQQIREHTGEVTKLIPQERVQSNTVEQIVDVPVASIQQETGRMTQLIPQKRLSDHVVEQTVDVPGPQIQEQDVGGAKTIPQECVQSEVAPMAQSSRSYGLTAELHSGQILDLQNTVKAMNALHDVVSTLEQACRNDNFQVGRSLQRLRCSQSGQTHWRQGGRHGENVL